MTKPLQSRSARAASLGRPNPLRALTAVIDAVDGGINLGQGVCDLDPPKPLVDGALESISGGAERQVYTPYLGLPELREQIADHRRRFHGQSVDPDQVVVTLGSSGAMVAVATVFLDPGDEVLLFEPFYSYHRSALQLCGATVRGVRLDSANDLRFDPEALRAAIGPKTKAVVVNTPANPSGKVFRRSELEQLAEVLAGTEILVLTDEVYEHMVFDGLTHTAPATVPGLEDRSITLGSFSKTFSVTGWRIGYAIADAEAAEAIGRACDQLHVCAPRPMQRGVQRALEQLPESFYRDLGRDYERRRDRLCSALTGRGFEVLRPEGAYYVLADYRSVLGDLDPFDAAHAMIDRFRINGVPGDVFRFDAGSERTLRFHFAVDDEVLDEVVNRLTPS